MADSEPPEVLFRAKLHRDDRTIPWGFRLQGGAEFNKPLTLLKVLAESTAAKARLRPGDIVVRIAGRSTEGMTHKEAQQAILTSGNSLEIIVERADVSLSLDSEDTILETSNINTNHSQTNSCKTNIPDELHRKEAIARDNASELIQVIKQQLLQQSDGIAIPCQTGCDNNVHPSQSVISSPRRQHLQPSRNAPSFSTVKGQGGFSRQHADPSIVVAESCSQLATNVETIPVDETSTQNIPIQFSNRYTSLNVAQNSSPKISSDVNLHLTRVPSEDNDSDDVASVISEDAASVIEVPAYVTRHSLQSEVNQHHSVLEGQNPSSQNDLPVSSTASMGDVIIIDSGVQQEFSRSAPWRTSARRRQAADSASPSHLTTPGVRAREVGQAEMVLKNQTVIQPGVGGSTAGGKSSSSEHLSVSSLTTDAQTSNSTSNETDTSTTESSKQSRVLEIKKELSKHGVDETNETPETSTIGVNVDYSLPSGGDAPKQTSVPCQITRHAAVIKPKRAAVEKQKETTTNLKPVNSSNPVDSRTGPVNEGNQLAAGNPRVKIEQSSVANYEQKGSSLPVMRNIATSLSGNNAQGLFTKSDYSASGNPAVVYIQRRRGITEEILINSPPAGFTGFENGAGYTIVYDKESDKYLRRYSLPGGSAAFKSSPRPKRVHFAESVKFEEKPSRERRSRRATNNDEQSLSDTEYSSVSSLAEKLDRLELENALESAAISRSRPFQRSRIDEEKRRDFRGDPRLIISSRSSAALEPIEERRSSSAESGYANPGHTADSDCFVFRTSRNNTGGFSLTISPDSSGSVSVSVKGHRGDHLKAPVSVSYVRPTTEANKAFTYSLSSSDRRDPITIQYSLPPSYEESVFPKSQVEHVKSSSWDQPSVSYKIYNQRPGEIRSPQSLSNNSSSFDWNASKVNVFPNEISAARGSPLANYSQTVQINTGSKDVQTPLDSPSLQGQSTSSWPSQSPFPKPKAQPFMNVDVMNSIPVQHASYGTNYDSLFEKSNSSSAIFPSSTAAAMYSQSSPYSSQGQGLTYPFNSPAALAAPGRRWSTSYAFEPNSAIMKPGATGFAPQGTFAVNLPNQMRDSSLNAQKIPGLFALLDKNFLEKCLQVQSQPQRRQTPMQQSETYKLVREMDQQRFLDN